jgi:Domain of unknown function (DUF5666)
MHNKQTSDCSRRAVVLAIAGVVAELAGCGGGGTDTAGLSSGGTGSFTSGTITGFGSIIVNGIRYDDSAATIVSDEDSIADQSALQIGVVVVIEGSAINPARTPTDLPFATANRITYGSEWLGPVSNVVRSGASNTFEMLGNTVDVLASTVFSGSATQMSELSSNHYAEVYGYVDQSTGHLQASRIEVTTIRPTTYKLGGAIDQVLSMTAKLGQTRIAWGDASVLSADMANGASVHATLNTTPSGAVYTATRIRVLTSPLMKITDDKVYKAEIKGSVTDYKSNAQFTVKGIPVDASQARVSGSLRLGAQVEVKGTVKSGLLTATEVSVETVEKVESKEYEFIGYISNLNAQAQTFVLKELTFDYDSNTENKSILNNKRITEMKVKVKAKRTNGRWLAIEIESDD